MISPRGRGFMRAHIEKVRATAENIVRLVYCKKVISDTGARVNALIISRKV